MCVLFVSVRFSSVQLGQLTCSVFGWYDTTSSAQTEERGIIKNRLQNTKLKNCTEEEMFRKQERNYMQHWVTSPTVTNLWFGGSHVPQPGSLSAPTQASPLVRAFMLLAHVIDWSTWTTPTSQHLLRRTAYNKTGLLWACVKHGLTNLIYSHSKPVLETGPQDPVLYFEPLSYSQNSPTYKWDASFASPLVQEQSGNKNTSQYVNGITVF